MSTSVLDSFAGGWCHPPFTPPPPPPPPGAQGAYGPHHRHTNNIWCDPGLYQPYPQPPRMSHPGVRAPHHPHPPSGFHMGGPPGRGGGHGGRGFGRGQGGGRGGGRGGHHPQHGGQNSNHGNSFNNKGMVSGSFFQPWHCRGSIGLCFVSCSARNRSNVFITIHIISYHFIRLSYHFY